MYYYIFITKQQEVQHNGKERLKKRLLFSLLWGYHLGTSTVLVLFLFKVS